MILEAVGSDLNAPDIAKTPQRVAQMYEEILSGHLKDPAEELDVVLEQSHDEIILVKDIPLYSVCEHPFIAFYWKGSCGVYSR